MFDTICWYMSSALMFGHMKVVEGMCGCLSQHLSESLLCILGSCFY